VFEAVAVLILAYFIVSVVSSHRTEAFREAKIKARQELKDECRITFQKNGVVQMLFTKTGEVVEVNTVGKTRHEVYKAMRRESWNHRVLLPISFIEEQLNEQGMNWK